MRRIRKRCFPSLCLTHISGIAFLVAVMVFCICHPLPALGDGGKSKLAIYESWEINGIELAVQFEGVLFFLNTAGDKYKVIRLRVTNDSAKPLLLSPENDAIKIIFKDHEVNGILDLFRRDPAFWSTLEPEMREALAYPKTVPARGEESVFIFIPKDTPVKLPEQIRFKINSLSREVILAPPVMAS